MAKNKDKKPELSKVTLSDTGEFESEAKHLYKINDKAKITGADLKGDFCHYTYDLFVTDNLTDALKRKSGVIVHDDLKAAFKKFNPHLAVICEEVEKGSLGEIDDMDEDLRNSFEVTSFSVSGYGEEAGIVLTGTKLLSTSEKLHLTTPKTKWDGFYEFIDDLRATADNAIREVALYMGGKAAPVRVQSKLDFPDQDENNEDSDFNENEER